MHTGHWEIIVYNVYNAHIHSHEQKYMAMDSSAIISDCVINLIISILMLSTTIILCVVE